MTSWMGLQIAELRERLLAAGVLAFVRFLAGMRTNVLLKMWELRELKAETKINFKVLSLV